MRIWWLAALTAPLAACSALPASEEPQTPEVANVRKADLTITEVNNTLAEKAALKPIPIDVQTKVEYVEVVVDSTVPEDMKKLQTYLLQADEWTPLKVEQLYPTIRRYRFRRLTPSAPQIPTPDPLAPALD